MTDIDCAPSYQAALADFFSGAGENALAAAYELGRQMISEGMSLLDLADLHRRALQEWLESNDAPNVSVVVNAATFFAESLASFDMHFRRIDESSAAWRRVSKLLEEEIKRISLALHSEAGNILAQAALEMDLALQSLPLEWQCQLALPRRLLDETGDRLRHLSHELRPTALDDLGLVPALQFLAEGVERRTGTRVLVQGTMDRRVASDAELAVYRIAQEAINNALRHGGRPLSITIRVEMRGERLYCAIADDGAGFNVTDALGDKRRPSLGLLSMRERVASFGGEFKIVSRPGVGTIVDLVLPL